MTAARTRLNLEAEIAELSPGGDGVAICTIDGERRAVFVAGVASGERVRLDVDPSTRPARARLLEVITPSTSRVASPCAHTKRCGGCDWMHLAPIEQAAEHARMVARLLGVPKETTVNVHPALHVLGYRTRARLHLEAKKRAHGAVVVGMFARQSHEPAAVDTCVVLDPVLDRVRGSLAAWLDGARGSGEASIALGPFSHQNARLTRLAVMDLRWKGDDLPAAIFGRLENAVKNPAAELAGARIFSGDVRVPAKIGDPTPFIAGADGEPLRLGFGGFAQANDAMNVLLARRVAELARSAEPGPCVELYAGAGNFTVLLARDREELIAVEQDKDACAAARLNLAARGREAAASTRIVEGDASTFEIPKNTKLVVLDPPREGARAVAETLVSARRVRKPTIIYVGCDPPTLARDVKTLTQGGYAIASIDTFEMFPQTSHVESVVVLKARS